MNSHLSKDKDFAKMGFWHDFFTIKVQVVLKYFNKLKLTKQNRLDYLLLTKNSWFTLRDSAAVVYDNEKLMTDCIQAFV